MSDYKKRDLSSFDRSFLQRDANVNWIPKDPAELVLPYMEREGPEEKSGIEIRRERAKEVVQKYKEIAEKCKEIEDELSQRCKDVKVSIKGPGFLRIREACNRTFGRDDIEEITFEMYKAVVEATADESEAATPGPEESV